MRYSKGKKIAIAIIAVICIFAVGFGIYKGIDYSKNLTEEPVSSKLTASVKEKEETKKKDTKTTKKTTKKEEKKTEEKKKTVKKEETKTTTTKKETKKTETKKEEKKEETKNFSDSRVGSYKVVSLKVKKKTYSKQELEKLSEAGYSLKLQLDNNGLATVSVLSINKMYEYTDSTFYDGENTINYTYKKNKLSITIDNYEIVFEKE